MKLINVLTKFKTKMRINTLIIIVSATALTLLSCNSRSESLLDPKTGKPVNQKQAILYENEAAFENTIQSIENDSNLTEFNSLDYNNSNEGHELKGLVNASGEPQKLTHENTKNSEGEKITRHFYFKNRKLVCTIERIVNASKGTSSVTETKSYYDQNERVVFSAKRIAESEDSINTAHFIKAKKTAVPLNTAIEILNQKGPFETRFKGFLDQKYIIVGSKGSGGYNSALMLKEEENSTINMLINDEKKYLDKLLKIQFSPVFLAKGFEAQGLESLEIIEE